jgi:hypothetical protein
VRGGVVWLASWGLSVTIRLALIRAARKSANSRFPMLLVSLMKDTPIHQELPGGGSGVLGRRASILTPMAGCRCPTRLQLLRQRGRLPVRRSQPRSSPDQTRMVGSSAAIEPIAISQRAQGDCGPRSVSANTIDRFRRAGAACEGGARWERCCSADVPSRAWRADRPTAVHPAGSPGSCSTKDRSSTETKAPAHGASLVPWNRMDRNTVNCGGDLVMMTWSDPGWMPSIVPGSRAFSHSNGSSSR